VSTFRLFNIVPESLRGSHQHTGKHGLFLAFDVLTRCPQDLGFRLGKTYYLCATRKGECENAIVTIRDPETGSLSCVVPEKLDNECLGPLRLIVFEPVEPDVVGFIAAVSRALALKGISILTYSDYRRDYLLIPEESVEKAIEALEEIGCSFQGRLED